MNKLIKKTFLLNFKLIPKHSLSSLRICLAQEVILHLEFIKWYSAVLCLVSQPCLTLCDPMDFSPPGSSVLGDSPGKNIGMGCHALF